MWIAFAEKSQKPVKKVKRRKVRNEKENCLLWCNLLKLRNLRELVYTVDELLSHGPLSFGLNNHFGYGEKSNT